MLKEKEVVKPYLPFREVLTKSIKILSIYCAFSNNIKQATVRQYIFIWLCQPVR